MKEKDENVEEGQIYEVGFHILPTLAEEKLPEIVVRIKDVITNNGGEVISDDFPKQKVLAYEIKKRIDTKYVRFNRSYFGSVKFEILSGEVEKIKKEMESNGDILRFIIVKTVRENTMYTPKYQSMSRGNVEEKVAKSEVVEPVEKVEISEEEIDKSIDELLVNEN
jgi:ribosomal protein S6